MSSAVDGIRAFSWQERLADMADARLDVHGTNDSLGLALGSAAVLASAVHGQQGASL